ncbi:MAG: hypothetical protein M3Y05_03050, partial [Gemmatimonadota bacterium]|nr:hypothetical protein [Gemmatimonadota bacterium]
TSLISSHLVDRVPKDPQSGASYTYLVGGASSYRLCATFAQPADTTNRTRVDVFLPANRSWTHGTGESCFDLTPPERKPGTP